MTNGEQVTQPSNVTTAIRLLYGSLVVGVARSTIEFSRLAAASSVELVLFLVLSSLLFILFCTYMIGKRKNWARITFLVVLVFGTLGSISPMIQSFSHSPIAGVFGILQFAMQTIALVFLFQKDSSAWFTASRI